MREVGLPASDRVNYRYWPIPRKTGESPDGGLPALVLGGPSRELDRNLCYSTLREMRTLVSAEHIRAKYDRTIRFLEEMGTILTVA